jgi:protoporphyrinogen oxidase/peptidoglycan/xylan/chitin deacetylase (PgdA/CDA1 family)
VNGDIPVDGRRWAVIGGGILGLRLADRLARAGHRVTVFEAAPHVGGLASAWTIGDVVWDRHYHVTLLSDTATRDLLSGLGLESEMEWVETRTGVYTGRQLYSVSNGVEFLRFPALRMSDKARLGATIVYGSKVRDWQRLERISVERWLKAWSGRRTFETFWLPLLRSKLGDSYERANAAFIWATIQRLYAARRTGLKREMFGYVPGGYARILEHLGRDLRARGVEIRLAASATSVERVRDGEIRVTRPDGESEHFDEVIVTTNTTIANRLIAGLTEAERAQFSSIDYQGIVCASVLLDTPLSPYYLTYITDEAPFTAVVEMTAMVDRSEFGGRSLVYLPKYCRPGDPTAQRTDEEIEEQFLDALERMYPDFRRSHAVAFRISRVGAVFAVPTLGYSRSVPGFSTSVPGVHLVTSAQIVNGTLNVNETVQLADRAARALLSPVPEGSAPVTRVPGSAPARARAVRSLLRPREGRPERPAATLSVDLDNLWSYLKTSGDPNWRTFPSFLDVVVPELLELLDDRDLAATWFVVGRDAEAADHGDVLRRIVRGGHEIANHSYLHEPWLHRYPRDAIEQDILRSQRAILEATGVRTVGFRGPGYSLSSDVVQVLADHGYEYDASTLPTFVGPLARAFYMRGTELTAAERDERAALFGPFSEGRRPLGPYRWRSEPELVEVPVTTMPMLRTPIHMSYLVALAEYSPRVAHGYLAAALRLCRTAHVAPSMLLHSHDVVGGDDVPEMRFFPGFRMTGTAKRRFVASCLDHLNEHFQVTTLHEFVRCLGPLSQVDLRFPDPGPRLEPSSSSAYTEEQ